MFTRRQRRSWARPKRYLRRDSQICRYLSRTVGSAASSADEPHHTAWPLCFAFRERLDLTAVEQIGLEAVDAPGDELFAQAGIAEARGPDHGLARSRRLASRAKVGPILLPMPRIILKERSWQTRKPLDFLSGSDYAMFAISSDSKSSASKELLCASSAHIPQPPPGRLVDRQAIGCARA
jgi:hypothetical protein